MSDDMHGGAMHAVYVRNCPSFARAKEIFFVEFQPECQVVGGLSCEAPIGRRTYDARDYD
jgi:hypothetical protein